MRKIGQTAELQWNCESGWSVISTSGGCKLVSLNVSKPQYMYVSCTRRGTGSSGLLYFVAVVDISPKSMTEGQIVSIVETGVDDELHHGHFFTRKDKKKFFISPGLYSSSINIIDATNPHKPTLHKRIEPKAVKALGLATLHTTHDLPNGELLISALSKADGSKGAGFINLPSNFDQTAMTVPICYDGLNYDFGYKECIRTMISTEWSYVNIFDPGFNPDDVAEGKYGHQALVWNYWTNTLEQTIEFRDHKDIPHGGEIPLEIRFFHWDHETRAYVGCTLSGTIVALTRNNRGKWFAEEVIHVPTVDGVIAAITDITISSDNKYLYFSNWLQGDIRQYDISNWLKPVLVSQIWMGGLLGKPVPTIKGKYLNGGPQMLRLTQDNEHLYVTNSLYSTWDDQFYNTEKNNINKNGSWLCRVITGTKEGEMVEKAHIDKHFLVDFANANKGPSRAHECHIDGVPIKSYIRNQ